MKQKSRWSLSRSLSQGDKMALADSPKDFGVWGREGGGVEREKERKEWERGKRGESFTVKRFHNKIL